MAFTGIPDIDLGILSDVPDRDLPEVCTSNRYVYELCSSDRHWKIRLERNLGIKGNYPFGISAKEYYQFLTKENTPEIERLLNLTPEENYIRVRTRQGYILKGSEKYRSLGIVMPRAFKEGNRELVGYYMGIYRDLIGKYNSEKERLLIFPPEEAVASAVDYVATHEGEEELLAELIRLYSSTANEDESYEMDLTAQALGRYNMYDFFKANHSVLYPAYNDELQIHAFLAGLIEGNHYNAFIKLASPYLKGDVGIIGLVGSHAKEALVRTDTDPRFLQWLLEHHPCKWMFFGEIARTALEAGRLELGAMYEEYLTPQEVYNALLKGDPEMAISYFEEHKDKIRPSPKATLRSELIKAVKEGREREAIQILPHLEIGTSLVVVLIEYRDIIAYILVYLATTAPLDNNARFLIATIIQILQTYAEWQHFTEAVVIEDFVGLNYASLLALV